MNQQPDELIRELKAIPAYVRMCDQTFGGQHVSAVTMNNMSKAIAAFERTLTANNTPFDRYAAGDAMARPDALIETTTEHR